MANKKPTGTYFCCSNCESTEIKSQKNEDTRKVIRNQYGTIADKKSERNNKDDNYCRKDNPSTGFYSKAELKDIPQNAILGLGSGNPITHSNIKEGEIIVDLGSGGGIDCFIAANITGQSGKVIGVDMTPQMIDLARENALKSNYQNVEFRLGEIEHLPIADNIADLIISNCVINLASNKDQVFREAFRVLKPGGRLIISDIMFSKKLPEKVKMIINSTNSCISRAVLMSEYLDSIKKAGFTEVGVIDEFIIRPNNSKSTQQKPTENQQITIISDGKEITIELTPEEFEYMNDAIISAHLKALKPQ